MRTLVCGAVLAFAGAAFAEEPGPYGNVFHRFEINAGLGAGGPVLFRDVPNATLEPATVFEIGPRVGFRFGATGVDPHRFGLMVGFNSLARSTNRTLAGVDPVLVYAAGGATEMQVGVGARIALASEGFISADGTAPYTGPMATLELRHSFIDEEASGVPLGMVAGLFSEAVLGSPAAYSSAFVGARVDLTFRKAQ